MTKWFQWIVLTAVTGSPLLSILILLVFWWAADRFTFRLLPDPVRFFKRYWRAHQLEKTLSINPHDRRARFELADLRLSQRRYAQASDLLRANLEQGEDDPATLFMMALALIGTGHPERAERLLEAAEEADPNFRVGAISLERGRSRLSRGDAAGAREALERFVKQRTGTVEGRVLLAKALERSGDATAAEQMRAQAWREYASAPFHLQRQERFWAWRARPSRPAIYLAIVLVGGFVFGRYVAPSAQAYVAQLSHSNWLAEPQAEDFPPESEYPYE